MTRRLTAFVVALLVMVVLGTAANSYMVQQAWSSAALEGQGAAGVLSTGERLSWFLHDLVGMQPLFGGLVGVALLVAFTAGALMARFTGLRWIVLPVAGAVAIFVLFTALKMALGTVGVFGARGTTGLGLQMIAGLISGFVFEYLSRPRTA